MSLIKENYLKILFSKIKNNVIVKNITQTNFFIQVFLSKSMLLTGLHNMIKLLNTSVENK